MLSMVKLIMHRHVRITAFCSRLPAWLTYHRALSLSHYLLTYPDDVPYIITSVSLCQLAIIFLTLDR